MEEKEIMQSQGGEFLLTNKRVRQNTIEGGSGFLVSIPLEKITGSAIRKKSNPVLLIMAAIAILLGLGISAESEEAGGLIGGGIFAIIMVAIYFQSRSQVLSFSSASESINLNIKDIYLEKAVEVMNEVESAIANNRNV